MMIAGGEIKGSHYLLILFDIKLTLSVKVNSQCLTQQVETFQS